MCCLWHAFYTVPGVLEWHHKTPIKNQNKEESCNFLLLRIQAGCLKVMEFCGPEQPKARALMKKTQPNNDKRAVSHRES